MSIENLLNGYRRFHQAYFHSSNPLYQRLSDLGQQPDCLVISCSDSRVDPSIIFDAQPGELFVIRNVANLIPPFQVDHASLHGVSAALEFAVQQLNIKHIIVLGHSQCAGIKVLYTGLETKSDFIEDWVNMASPARQYIKTHFDEHPLEEQLHLCEKETIKYSLKNLATFPWIKDKISAGILDIHGWHFQLYDGSIERYNEKQDCFVAI